VTTPEEIYRYVEANPGSTRWDVSRGVGLKGKNIDSYLASCELAGMYLSEDSGGGLYPFRYCSRDDLLSTTEAAKKLGISRRKCWRLCVKGRLPAFQIGHFWYVEGSKNALEFPRP